MNVATTRLTAGSVLACLIVLACWPTPTRADGLIIIEPDQIVRPTILPPCDRWMPLEIRKHHVEATITDTVAVTRIDQSFFNPTGRQLEGTYIFPLADDVAVQRFSMWMDGREVSGELLDKDRARQTYEEIVRKMRDPALLEYVGSRMFKARVFPIPAHGEVKIALEYSQNIAMEHGLGCYRYPLNTEKFSARPIESVAVRVRLESQVPLRNVFCPSHDVSIDRHGDCEAVVGYEERNARPDRDLLVYYQLTDQEFGLAMLAHCTSGQDGFFMARIAPQLSHSPGKVMPKDVCFVIDTSGSMAGQKIRQAQEALRFCLNNLNDADRFNIIRFATEAQPYRNRLIEVTGEAVEDAIDFVDGMSAGGGTNIYAALSRALEDMGGESRAAMIVFLTDGQPTVEVTDVGQIIKKITDQNRDEVRLFVFGVGNDVNTQLLDKLSEQNHGAREYVGEKEDLELKLSGFFAKLAHPMLSDLAIEIAKVGAYDIYPKRLPDLFKGTELVIFGRYRDASHATVTLRGSRRGSTERFTYETELPRRELGNDFVPRLWAIRKIGHLLDEIQLHGENQELKQEIIRLSKQYGIMTPYTSFLVLEEEKLVPMAQRDRRVWQEGRSIRHLDTLGYVGGVSEADTGGVAIQRSQSTGVMKGAAPGAEAPSEVSAMVLGLSRDMLRSETGEQQLRHIGPRAFYRVDDRWIDSGYDERKAKTTRIELFSDEYFALIAKRPELARYFAQAPHVVVMVDGTAYETFSP